jgi:hypothetical protein
MSRNRIRPPLNTAEETTEMGTLIFFPTDRYGSVTRNTEQPHAVERLAAWLRKVAHIRASASMGCEETLEQAPNVVPLSRHYTKGEAMATAIASAKVRAYFANEHAGNGPEPTDQTLQRIVF